MFKEIKKEINILWLFILFKLLTKKICSKTQNKIFFLLLFFSRFSLPLIILIIIINIETNNK